MKPIAQNIINTFKSEFAFIGAAITALGLLHAFMVDSLQLGKLETSLSCIIIFLIALICLVAKHSTMEAATPFRQIRGNEGEELIECIKHTKTSMVLTAFSKDKPSQKYIDAIKKALERGVAVKRYITAAHQADPQFSYTQSLTRPDLYTEVVLNTNLFPFDIYIFDNQETRLYFPTHAELGVYTNGASFVSPEIAVNFRTALESLQLKQAA